MASIKNFKKELVATYGTLLDECFFNQLFNEEVDKQKFSALEEKIETGFDKVYALLLEHKGIENKKAYIKDVRKQYIESLSKLVEEFNSLV